VTEIKNNKKIRLSKFLIVGFVLLFLLNFIPPNSNNFSYDGPVNPCYFWCDGPPSPTVKETITETGHGFPFEALFTEHQKTINGMTSSSNEIVDWHNLAIDTVFVIILSLLIIPIIYLVYSLIYKKRHSINK